MQNYAEMVHLYILTLKSNYFAGCGDSCLKSNSKEAEAGKLKV